MRPIARTVQSKVLPSEQGLLKSQRLGPFWRKIDERLAVYGSNRHGNPDDPLDELVFIILSAQTEWYLYRKAFEDLFL